MGRELIFGINATADESAAEEGSTAQVTFCRKKKKSLSRFNKKAEGSTLFSREAAVMIRADIYW